METTILSPVSFTNSAIIEIKRIMQDAEFDKTQVLRVAVKGGGCSGMTYVLGFDKKEEGDNIHTTSGIEYVMKSAHEIYLLGMEINWEDGLNNRGFTFKNPNASSTCGCGTSFAV